MDSKLGIEVGEGEEMVSIVEAALILAVAALHLAIVARRVRADFSPAYLAVAPDV